MDQIVVPAGWPRRVRPPGAPGWEESVQAWLLDQVPGARARAEAG